MLLINVRPSSKSATLQNEELSSSRRDVYWLTPADSNHINSTSVLLNGVLLELVGPDDMELPDLNPVEQPASSRITLPPRSFGFYVFKDSDAQACM